MHPHAAECIYTLPLRNSHKRARKERQFQTELPHLSPLREWLEIRVRSDRFRGVGGHVAGLLCFKVESRGIG